MAIDQLRFCFLLVLGTLSLLGVSAARADILECVLKEKAGSVTVADESTKKKVATLQPGDRVYLRWVSAEDVTAYVVDTQRFRPVTGLKGEMLDCDSAGASNEYPIVFEGLNGRVQLYNEFGIQADPVANDPDRERLPKVPHKCFYIGDGFMGMELTEKTAATYRKQGFSLANLCMVLRSGQIRFDPETGKRLPTYVIVDKAEDPKVPAAISAELPLYAPACFARGKTMVTPSKNSATMKPLGCTVNYHPWSGRRLGPEEVKFFTREAALQAAGEAGEVLEDSNDLANDASRRASTAKIQAIKSQGGTR